MVEKFLEYLFVEQRYSTHTVASYRKDLRDFCQFHLDKESSEDISTANTRHIRNFIFFCGEKELSKRTINRKISSLRSFYNFLLKINEIAISPLDSIKSLKMHPEKQIPYSKEEMLELKNVLQNPEVPLLDFLILETLYQTGMRKAELCNLLITDVDFDSFQLKFIGKGNKQRIVPISKELISDLKSYFKSRHPIEDHESYFFINKNGKKVNEKFIYRVVNKYLDLVTRKEKKNPHSLRHSFATHLLENGAKISEVKELLGHASLLSTQVYTNTNIEQLKKVFDNANPRSKKK